jgi:hypothetical protein
MAKRRFSSRLASDEITTIMIAELAVTSGLGSSFD